MNLRYQLCAICGARATEGHHIIPRSCGEHGPMYQIPLCKACHQRWHQEGHQAALKYHGITVGPDEYAPECEMWGRMGYSVDELQALIDAPEQRMVMYPRMRARKRWAEGEIKRIKSVERLDEIE